MRSIPTNFVLSVVVPVNNENRMPAALVETVRAMPIRNQIVPVEDRSIDRSRDIMETFVDYDRNMFVKRHHDVNRDEGAALGLRFVRQSKPLSK